MISEKECTKCKRTLSVEEFSKYKSRRNGLRSSCKACCSHARKEWRIKNPDKDSASDARYREKHREQIAAYRKIYRKINREKLLECERKWRKKNMELYLSFSRKCNANARSNLSDSYVRRLLIANIGVGSLNIPQEMIDLKRMQLKLKRHLDKQES